MKTVTLTRTGRAGKAVRGTIALPFATKTLEYPTLENADFLIPAGTYPLKLTWSPRFKKLMPLVDAVPDREGIRIHMGTRPEHSEGCILVDGLALDNIKILIQSIAKFNDNIDDENEREDICIRIEGLEESTRGDCA